MASKKSAKNTKKLAKPTRKRTGTSKRPYAAVLINKYSRLIVILLIILAAAVFGIVHNSAKPISCKTEECFTPKFKSCTPATLDFTIEILGSIHYQIISGDANGRGCKMTLTYTKMPNPEWENQSITCVFNTKLSLSDTVSDVFSDLASGQNSYECTGPLVRIIQKEAGH